MPQGRALFPWVSVDGPQLWQGDCLGEFSRGVIPGGWDEESLEPIRTALRPCQVGQCCIMPGFLPTQGSVGFLRLLLARLSDCWECRRKRPGACKVWQGVTWMRTTFQWHLPSHRQAGKDSRGKDNGREDLGRAARLSSGQNWQLHLVALEERRRPPCTLRPDILSKTYIVKWGISVMERIRLPFPSVFPELD